MSTLVFDGLELNDLVGDADGRIVIDLVVGFWGGLVVRGGDKVVPSRVGRYPRNRELDLRTLNGHGEVLGIDEQGFAAKMDLLEAVLNPTADPAALVVHGPYLGLPAGVTRTIQARFVNYVPVWKVLGLALELDVKWEAVDPPTWVEAS
jgi:hypothetical protein